jgi:protein-L-isoaspartate O-methyltransferase
MGVEGTRLVSPTETNTLWRLLQCLTCKSSLHVREERIACAACGAQWPWIHGVPHFHRAETAVASPLEDAARYLVEQSRETGWTRMLRRHPEYKQPRSAFSLLDWQQASWLPWLGLGTDAVALEVGAGHGAITWALAQSLGRVYAMETDPAALSFNRWRLDHERVANVQLLHATPMQLPFPPASFDLIVVNRVLERIHLWSDGACHEAQVDLLSRLASLLREGGVLVLPVANRFSYHMLAKRFRWGESRRSWKRERSARSENGYRTLLEESGFAQAEFHMARPSIIEPYFLTPLQKQAVKDHLEARIAGSPTMARHPWRRALKRLAVRFSPAGPATPFFVILASRDNHLVPRWRLLQHLASMGIEVGNHPTMRLVTRRGAVKNVITVVHESASGPRYVIRTSTAVPGSAPVLQRVFQSHKTAWERLSDQKFDIPQPHVLFQCGSYHYTIEGRLGGRPLSELFWFQSPASRLSLFREFLSPSIDLAVCASLSLRGAQGAIRISDLRWQLPDSLRGTPEADAIEEALTHRDDQDWVQHGDFTLNNVLLDQVTGRLSLVDWESLVQGVPPLFDVYTLLLTSLHLAQNYPGGEQDHQVFDAVLFGRGPWADTYREGLRQACNRLALTAEQAWIMFLQSLAIRMLRHYDLRLSHPKFLRVAVRKRAQFLLFQH